MRSQSLQGQELLNYILILLQNPVIGETPTKQGTVTILRVGFWQKLRTDFSRIFIFGPPDFFADFVAGFFLLIFVGKKCPEKSSRKIPGKILQNLYNKNPRQLSVEGLGQLFLKGRPVGGQNRVDLSFCAFPCFVVFEGCQNTQMPGKNSTKSVTVNTPFCVCVPQIQGEIIYAPPPSPPFLAIRHFSGEGGGGAYFEAPRGRNFIPPPFYTPPTLRRVILGVGGWGCIKFGPVPNASKS